MLDIIRYSIKNEKLAPFIKFIWQIDTAEANLHYKLLPTECIDVIINLASEMTYEVNSQRIVAPRFHINGLRSKHSYLHQEKDISVFGISFYSYGLYPFVTKPIKVIQNTIIDLQDFAPNIAKRFCSVFETVKNKTGFEIEAAIEQALLSALINNEDDTAIARLIFEFMTRDKLTTVSSFCSEHALNIKTFERMVLSYTGFAPKNLKNIKRFQLASNQLCHGTKTSLAGIAVDNQFADQAHFTKEFKRFSGAAPRQFITENISVKENAKYTYR